MNRWRRSFGDENCGALPAKDCVIARGEPLQEIYPRVMTETPPPGMRPLIRCRKHGVGAVPEMLPEFEDPRPYVPGSSVPVRRVADLPFDAKAAAAGKDD